MVVVCVIYISWGKGSIVRTVTVSVHTVTWVLVYHQFLLDSLLFVIAKPSLLASISAADYDPRDLDTYEWRRIFQILMGVVLGVYLLGACLGMWFFYIVLYCYVYFKEKELAKTRGFAMVSMRPGSSTDIPWYPEMTNSPILNSFIIKGKKNWVLILLLFIFSLLFVYLVVVIFFCTYIRVELNP